MKNSIKFAVFATMLALCSIAFAAPPADSSHSPKAASKQADNSPQNLIFNRKLASTTISLGDDVVDVGAGPVAIDSPLTFTCPKGGCTVTADIHVQMGFNTKTGNALALCAELDGNFMEPDGCPNVLTLPTDNSFVGGSWAFAQSGVAAGTHTLQGFVYTTSGATRAGYHITYQLFTP